jgi:hypothetical protein
LASPLRLPREDSSYTVHLRGKIKKKKGEEEEKEKKKIEDKSENNEQ